MADPSIPPSDYIGLAAWLLGAGGLGTILMGIGKYFFGPKAVPELPAPANPAPQSTVETHPHWLSFHVIENQMKVNQLIKLAEAGVAAQNSMAIQINTLTELLKQQLRRKPRSPARRRAKR